MDKVNLFSYESLGKADFGWLKAKYHFSFSCYHNLARMGFGTLRVINDDIVEAGKGFDPHSHDNMEIITYVRAGAITHQDSLGNTGRTAAGDVQVMSAGKGVTHSEYNHESEATQLYQIWILPNQRDVAPRWEAKAFPALPVQNQLPLLVSGQPEHAASDALFIYADAAIYGGKIQAGTTLTQRVKHQAYILASQGKFTVNEVQMQQGDGAEISDTKEIIITALTDAEILIIDVPADEQAL